MSNNLSLRKSIINLARMFLEKFLSAGLAYQEDTMPCDVDKQELLMGIKVEYEHTTSRQIAMRIALDHLTEIPDYYTRLEKMEHDANESKGSAKLIREKNMKGIK